jgi:hypothetical protein
LLLLDDGHGWIVQKVQCNKNNAITSKKGQDSKPSEQEGATLRNYNDINQKTRKKDKIMPTLNSTNQTSSTPSPIN